MAYADKRKAVERQNKYIKEHYDSINLTVPKGKKETIKAYAKSQNKSVNEFIRDLIDAELSKGKE